ncbi:YchF subfamily translation-associated GTPase [Mycoplasma ovis str. Michigan]|uniref:YchF subfamily translation-associated GTPase n=1 Tax=Mycoplasma ovis str. Michigan TaxID=1415773 RepID=A0ABM5P0U4_9MOLU|nr:GTPase [Mycoplasma ovis]AHC40050.1 YchF subfamily translation-associated GTPase [Mycoplasma ovis str. Michigan]
MSYKIALVGLPNVGKSSIFNLLSSQLKSNVAPYPFSTIYPVKSIIYLPDEKLDKLNKLLLWWFRGSLESSKLIKKYCSLELWDIAGIVPLDGTQDKTSELGPTFLSHIRVSDLILLVVRAFSDHSVPPNIKTFLSERPEFYDILSQLDSFEKENNTQVELDKSKELFEKYGLSDISFSNNTSHNSTLELHCSLEKSNIDDSVNIPKFSESILEAQLVLMTLIKSDLEILSKTIQKYSKNLKTNEKKLKILVPIKEELEQKKYVPISSLKSYTSLSSEDKEEINSLSLLSSKPIVLLANYGSSSESLEYLLEIQDWSKRHSLPFSSLNLEAEEIYSLLSSEEERREARESLYLKHSSKDKLFQVIKETLNLSSFYTFKLEDKSGKKYSLINWNWNLEPVSGEIRSWLFEKSEEKNYLYKCVASIHNQLSEYFISSKLIESDKFVNLSPLQEFSGELITGSKNYKLQGGEIVQIIA